MFAQSAGFTLLHLSFTALMRILGWVFTFIFISFTAVQYNDPDASWWMIFYFSLALISLVGALGKARSSWFVVAMIALAFGLGQYYQGAIQFLNNEDGIAFSQGMQNSYPYIEEAREFGGFLISFVGVLLMWWVQRRSERFKTSGKAF